MVSKVRYNLESLNLSAKQIKSITRNSGAEWPDELVNDYLTILRNFIDVSTATDSTADQVELNKNKIEINSDNIQNNSDNIQNNSDDISTNSDILVYQFGADSPLPYDETNTTYSSGNFCIYSGNYYKCLSAINKPAGSFSTSKWQEINIVENESRLYIQMGINPPLPYDDTNTTYSSTNYVTYNGLYYKCVAAIIKPAGPFNLKSWQEVNINENESRLQLQFGSRSPLPYDDTNTDYDIGDYMLRFGVYYKATEIIEKPAGFFNIDKWQEVNIKSLLSPSDFAQSLKGGAVLLMDLVENAELSNNYITLDDVIASPATYSQSHNQTIVDMVNSTKQKHNLLIVEFNGLVNQFNELLSNSKAAKQMGSA